MRTSSPDREAHPANSRWSRLELVFGQFRHAVHHAGYLHAWLKARGIPPPEFVGMDHAPSPNSDAHPIA